VKCEDCKGVKKEAVNKLHVPELNITCYLCEFHTKVVIRFIKDYENNGLTKLYKYAIVPLKNIKEKVVFT